MLALIDDATLCPAELPLRLGEKLSPPRRIAAGQGALQERDYVPRVDVRHFAVRFGIGHVLLWDCCL